MKELLAASDLVERFGCRALQTTEGVVGSFSGVAPLDVASVEQISFFVNEKYLEEAARSKAGAILCSERGAQALAGRTSAKLFVHKEPYVVFARVSQFFFKPRHCFNGVATQAMIDATAEIDSSVTIFPFAFVGPGARIGARSVLYPGVFVGAGSVIGEDCLLYPNAVVREGCRLGDRVILNPGAVIGGDGFGFAPSGMENVKIPQVGGVVIESDVEIGSNASIDRGAMADTRIGSQTKIDSLVQIGHNVVIGESCFIAALVGIAGSTTVGRRVTMAGQVGVAGHLKIGDQITLLGQAGVTKNLVEPGVYNGTPARPNREYLLQTALLNRVAAAARKESES